MQQVIKLTSFGTYKQKIGAGVHLAPKIKRRFYKIAVEHPVDDDCVINDIDELDKIIHTPGNKLYDDRLINKVIKALK